MLQYILQLKRTGRLMIDPLPADFGTMYFLYPAESGYMKGFRVTGLREKLAGKIRSVFKRDDEMRDYRPEKIY